MEHQSFNRTEPVPTEVVEYLTTQPEPPPEKLVRQMAIDAVRSCGWYNYNQEENET